MSQQKSSHSVVSPKNRVLIFARLRQSKMTRSTHTYVRGSTVKFYEWLSKVQSHTFPKGPTIWIYGDCHVGNLGPIGHTSGAARIQIRDLDQTVLGDPAHDSIRLGVLLATTTRGSDLPGVVTARMMEALMAGYLYGTDPDATLCLPPHPASVRTVMKATTARTWKELAEEWLSDMSPTIPLGRHFWPSSREERRELKHLVSQYEALTLVARLYEMPGEASVSIVDAAYWVKGCSSFEQRRYAVLPATDQDHGPRYRLIDIKEAGKAAASSTAAGEMPWINGERVVTGARRLSPDLGDRMAQGRMLGGSFFIRELQPQDLKPLVSKLEHEDTTVLAACLGNVVGLAHGSQMPRDVAMAWHRELWARHGRSIDAPSWLWPSIIDLLGRHERQYLEYCRAWAG